MDVHRHETRTDHAAIEAVPYRHYSCRSCLAWWHTEEHVSSVYPSSRWLGGKICTARAVRAMFTACEIEAFLNYVRCRSPQIRELFLRR